MKSVPIWKMETWWQDKNLRSNVWPNDDIEHAFKGMAIILLLRMDFIF